MIVKMKWFYPSGGFSVANKVFMIAQTIESVSPSVRVYIIIGTEASYKPESFEVSTLWIIISIMVSLFAAVVGGFICTLISKNARASSILAAIVLVLGIAFAVPELTRSDEDKPQMRIGDVSIFEAMEKSKQPGWLIIITPLIGTAGVVWGGRLKKQE